MYTGDVVIHIKEALDDDRVHDLEQRIGNEHGIFSACMHERTRHLMVVDFDPAQVRPSGIVRSFRGHGLHAQMVGF